MFQIASLGTPPSPSGTPASLIRSRTFTVDVVVVVVVDAVVVDAVAAVVDADALFYFSLQSSSVSVSLRR